jgi:hypothetical protein
MLLREHMQILNAQRKRFALTASVVEIIREATNGRLMIDAFFATGIAMSEITDQMIKNPPKHPAYVEVAQMAEKLNQLIVEMSSAFELAEIEVNKQAPQPNHPFAETLSPILDKESDAVKSQVNETKVEE